MNHNSETAKNPIHQYQFGDHQVRVILKEDGTAWFVAGDVAEALGYRESESMTRWLDDDEKGPHILGTLGGNQSVTIISESGLYHAILKSRRSEAKRFRLWVTEEVLPTIRRTGSYIILVQAGWTKLFAAFDNIPDSWYFVVSLSNRGEWS